MFQNLFSSQAGFPTICFSNIDVSEIGQEIGRRHGRKPFFVLFWTDFQAVPHEAYNTPHCFATRSKNIYTPISTECPTLHRVHSLLCPGQCIQHSTCTKGHKPDSPNNETAGASQSSATLPTLQPHDGFWQRFVLTKKEKLRCGSSFRILHDYELPAGLFLGTALRSSLRSIFRA